MGCNLKDLVVRKRISLADLSNRILAVDSYNIFYQFLTTIRQSDGSLLTDSRGDVTSHLIGLFNRTANLLQNNIRPVFVFDGKPPEIKLGEIRKRHLAKEEARKKYEVAREAEDIAQMRKYASRFAVLTEAMLDDAKVLIKLLGLPIVQAPSEGEAQVARIVRDNNAFAAVSQDYDTLLYKTPRLLHNLTITGRRKRIHGKGSISVFPELIELAPNLQNLGITADQLIALAIMVGTDYNPGGIKGIGPKTALKLVRGQDDFELLFRKLGFPDWEIIYNTIRHMPVAEDYSVKFKALDIEGLGNFLIKEREFSKERVDATLKKLEEEVKRHSQKGLGDFF